MEGVHLLTGKKMHTQTNKDQSPESCIIILKCIIDMLGIMQGYWQVPVKR